MQVRILEVLKELVGTVVRYECPLGSSLAMWPSRAIEPLPNAGFFVEYTFNEAVRVGENATLLGGESQPSVSAADSVVLIDGLVENVGEDGVAYLRSEFSEPARPAPDCLSLIESTPGALQDGAWLHLRLPVSMVELWPIDGGL